MTKVGIVGHRFFNDPEDRSFIQDQCRRLLLDLQHKNKGIIAISAIAEGADSIFAEVALAMNIPLQIIRPFGNYESDFTTAESRQRYFHLQKSACSETILPYKDRSDDAYYHAMKWIVDITDVMFAAWDGINNQRRGGTTDAIQQIKRNERAWVHINLTTRLVVHHC